ncbi:hypothetical protein LRC484719_33130 [Mycobacterium riyadhense]
MITRGGHFPSAPYLRRRLPRGVDGAYPMTPVQFQFVMIQDGAVGAVSFCKYPPDCGRRY